MPLRARNKAEANLAATSVRNCSGNDILPSQFTWPQSQVWHLTTRGKEQSNVYHEASSKRGVGGSTIKSNSRKSLRQNRPSCCEDLFAARNAACPHRPLGRQAT